MMKEEFVDDLLVEEDGVEPESVAFESLKAVADDLLKHGFTNVEVLNAVERLKQNLKSGGWR